MADRVADQVTGKAKEERVRDGLLFALLLLFDAVFYT